MNPDLTHANAEGGAREVYLSGEEEGGDARVGCIT
jgi:hypothetical protein